MLGGEPRQALALVVIYQGVSISLVFVNCVPAIGIRRRWIGVKSTERRGNAPARGAWGGYRTRWGTARRAPTPYQQGQGEGGSTPAAEVEQHLQQVGVVDDAVPVEVFVAVAALTEREQHL